MEKLTIGSVTVQGISSAPTVPYKNPNDVDFEVKYSDDYNGVKHMPEGVVTVSKEAAEKFTAMGIGKVVDASKVAEKAVEETTAPEAAEVTVSKEAAEQEPKSNKKGKS